MKKKEFGGLRHVASSSEFVPDTSLSAYNVSRNQADNVPNFNSILSSLRQNVADFVTQQHCTEIVDSATILLNPVQIIVDTSDQPV